MGSKKIWEFPENTNPGSGMVFLVDENYITQKLYLSGVTNYLESTGFSKFSNLYDAGIIYNSSGWTQSYDGTLTLPTVQVSIFNNSNYFTPPTVYTVVGGVTGTDFPDLVNDDTNYIFIDYNGGNPIYQISTDDSSINDSDVVRYLVAYRLDNEVHILDYGDQGAGLPNKLNYRLISTQKFARESGLSLGLSGDTGIPTLTSGVIWNGSHRQELPEISGLDEFYKSYHIGGSWTATTGNPYINNIYYDNGTNIVSGTTGKYLVNWYYRGEERENHFFEVYGNAQYDNISSAQLSTIPPVPELISSHTFIVGRIIIGVGLYSGTTIETVFTTPFQSTQVTSHNDLSNLQGGSAGEYYHLNANQYNNIALTNVDNNFTTSQTFNGELNINNSISATTYYGDGTNLLGSISNGSFNTNTNTIILNRNGGNILITGITDAYVTGFTYSNNNVTLYQNEGLSPLSVNISTMTGLTINGNLNVTGNTTTSGKTITSQLQVTSGSTINYVLISDSNGNASWGPRIPDWQSGITYYNKDLVIASYENEYRLFRAITNFTSSGGSFPGGQTIATDTNSYVGQWQEVSPLRGTMSNVSFSGSVSFNNTLTTSLSGDTNNYNPIGLSTCNFIRVTNTTGSNINLTGLKSPIPLTSQTIFICNVGVAQISLISNSVSSTVGNRFLLGGTKTLQNDEGIMLIYDPISLCWRSQAIQV
jgi:hypothetical protein